MRERIEARRRAIAEEIVKNRRGRKGRYRLEGEARALTNLALDKNWRSLGESTEEVMSRLENRRMARRMERCFLASMAIACAAFVLMMVLA